MNDRMKESLSALVDGEADELEIRRLLNQTEQDDELKEQWGRYQLMGAVMRGEPASTTDLSQGIMQALDGVPMDDVPASTHPEEHVVSSDVQIAEPTPQRSRTFHWLTSGAVAASVTLAVLLGARVVNTPAIDASAPAVAAISGGASSQTPVSSAPVAIIPAGRGGQLVAATTESLPYSPLPLQATASDQQTLSEEELRQAQDKLRTYVMQHSEHAALNTGRGLMPFARVSNFENDGQP